MQFIKLSIIFIGLILCMYATAATPVITFSKDNVVALTGEVTSASINSLILDIESKSSKTVYLYIVSPGGSVLAGQDFIDYLKTTDKDIICVAKVAISMAHHIFENCKTRIVQSDSIIMQHNMTAGTDGKIESMKRFLTILADIEHEMNVFVSKRIGMSLEKFELIIKDEWWVYGKKAVTLHLADSEAQVKCSSAAYTSSTIKNITVSGPFGSGLIKLKVYDCPLIDPEVISNDSGSRDYDLDKHLVQEYLSNTGLGAYSPK